MLLRLFTGLVVAGLISSSAVAAEENSGKDFTTSVIYGTLAGTLVGVATLAFTSTPGDNLNNVARGASYGMYAGILLGLYITYGIDDSPEAEDPGHQAIPQEPNIYEGNPPELEPGQGIGPDSRIKTPGPSLALFPILPSQSAPQDWGVGLQLMNVKF